MKITNKSRWLYNMVYKSINQSIYEDIEKLIFKTMDIIESDNLKNEIHSNETFERILDDYQKSKF